MNFKVNCVQILTYWVAAGTC